VTLQRRILISASLAIAEIRKEPLILQTSLRQDCQLSVRMNSVVNGMLLPHTPEQRQDACPVSPSSIKVEKITEMDKRYEHLASSTFKGKNIINLYFIRQNFFSVLFFI
jgi:hypothetical protein